MKLNESAKKSLRVSAYKIVSIKFIICISRKSLKGLIAGRRLFGFVVVDWK